jgi:hypothetical protein
MTKLDAIKIGELKGLMAGNVLLPTDPAYDEARQIWNAMIQKRPALIAQCVSTSDVVHAVKFARKNSLLLAIRGVPCHRRGWGYPGRP